MYIGLHVKYRLFLSDFNETWIFSKVLLKNAEITNFMKIRPVEDELFHADGRIDKNMKNLTVASRKFCERAFFF